MQLDNAGNNKNQFVFAYMAFLIMKRVFKTIEVHFLPVGHTHEDIDQMFSRLATYFRGHNAITLAEMMEACRAAFKALPMKTVEITEVAQFKQMVEEADCMRPMKGTAYILTHAGQSAPLSFRFTLEDDDVIVQYKHCSSDETWKDDVNGDSMKMFKPDMELDLSAVGPSTPEDTNEETLRQIQICLDSCESRINLLDPTEEHANMTSLRKEYEKLKEPLTSDFHWSTDMYEKYANAQLHEVSLEPDNGENEDDMDDSHEDSSDEDDSDRVEDTSKKTNIFQVGSRREQHDFSLGNFVVVNPGSYYRFNSCRFR